MSSLRQTLNPFNLLEKVLRRPIGAGTRGFFKDSLFFSASGMISKGAGFLLLKLITSRIPDPATTALYYLYTPILPLMAALMFLRLEQAVPRYYYEQRSDFPQFLRNCMIAFLCVGLVTMSYLWFGRGFWMRVLNLSKEEYQAAYYWELVTAGAYVLYLTYLALLTARRRAKAYFFTAITQTALYISAATFFLMVLPEERRAYGLIYAYSGSFLVMAPWFIWRLFHMMRPAARPAARPAMRPVTETATLIPGALMLKDTADKAGTIWDHWKYAFMLSLPIVPGSLANFVLGFYDRVVLGGRDMGEAGQYTFAFQIASLILILNEGVYYAYSPRFYEFQQLGDKERVQKFFVRQFRMLLLGATGLILMSWPIALLMGNERYFACLNAVPVIVSALLIQNLGNFYSLYCLWRRRGLLLISIGLVTSAVLTIILNQWLIPEYGYKAAALITLATYFLQYIFIRLTVLFYLRERETISFCGLKRWICLYILFALAFVIWGY